jgi:hypothetical protein
MLTVTIGDAFDFTRRAGRKNPRVSVNKAGMFFRNAVVR